MTLLSAIVFLPLIAAGGILFVPRNYRFAIRLVALAATGVTLLLAVTLFLGFNAATATAAGYKFYSQTPWVEALGISLQLGVDGLNVGLILVGAAHGGPSEYCTIAFIGGEELSAAIHLLEQAAAFIKQHVKKPVAAFIAGRTAPPD